MSYNLEPGTADSPVGSWLHRYSGRMPELLTFFSSHLLHLKKGWSVFFMEKMEKAATSAKNYDKKIFSFSRLQEPPRKVPFMLYTAMLFNAVGFPMSFSFAFILTALLSYSHPVDIIHQYMLGKNAAITEGKIISSKYITDEGEYRYIYLFEASEGKYYVGESRSGNEIAVGKPVAVEYLEKNPDISRMKGTKINFLLPIGMMFIIFGVYIMSLIHGASTAGSLRNGEVSDAEVKSVEEINDGEQKAYQITLEFMDKTGETVTFVHKTMNKERLLTDPTELVLYNPANSKNVWPVDEFPIPVEIDTQGEWRPPGAKLILRTLLHILLMLTPIAYGIVRFLYYK